MGMATDMKNLGEDIIASYDMRVKGEKDRLKGETERLKEFKPWWSAIQNEVQGLLEKFAKEHAAMADELKKALAKGETERLKEFKPWWSAIEKEVHDLLQEFQTEREKMAANWEALVATMAKKRSGTPVVSAGAEVKTVHEAVAEKGRGKKEAGKTNARESN